MSIVTPQNLSKFIDEVAPKLEWDVFKHKRIYQSVTAQSNMNERLDVVEKNVFPWIQRNGVIDSDWRNSITEAVNRIQLLQANLPNLGLKERSDLMQILNHLTNLKKTKRNRANLMPASKILHFFFPSLIPKIDGDWIQNICLRKVNHHSLFSAHFRVSGSIGPKLYTSYLTFGASQNYGPEVMRQVYDTINVKDAYAVAFEYCLLGFCGDEIIRLKDSGKSAKSC